MELRNAHVSQLSQDFLENKVVVLKNTRACPVATCFPCLCVPCNTLTSETIQRSALPLQGVHNVLQASRMSVGGTSCSTLAKGRRQERTRTIAVTVFRRACSVYVCKSCLALAERESAQAPANTPVESTATATKRNIHAAIYEYEGVYCVTSMSMVSMQVASECRC
jgi:hypothetical protein